jgi:hypothetical protein
MGALVTTLEWRNTLQDLMPNRAVFVALISAWMVTWALEASGQSAPTIGPEAYMDQEGYWPPDARPVAVCWETPESRHEAQQRMVRDSVKMHIEDQSGMRFEPAWPVCAEKSLGIRITVSDTAWPVSQVGRQYARGAGGQRLRQFGFYGDYQELPTAMTLNLQLNQLRGFEGCIDLNNREQRNDQCVRTVAVHEFLHAIGFLHEHLRPEARMLQPGCSDAVNPPRDFYGYKPLPVGDYDQRSIMNYCNNIYMGEPALSSGDLAALRLWYPAN